MPDIYNYVDLAAFLNDVFKAKKLKNASFSIRAWAKQLGLKHHNGLYEILQKKRKIPAKHILAFAKNLDLGDHELEYFSYLCKLDGAISQEEKDHYSKKLESIQKHREIDYVEIENISLVNDPLHFFIAELATTSDFQAEPAWIKKRLLHEYQEEEIQSAINRLVIARILVKNATGSYEKKHKNIITKSDVPSEYVKKYHANVLDLAKEALYQQTVEEREFRSLVFKMEPSSIGAAKERLRQLINQFMAEFETNSGVSAELYELNIQLFGISTKINDPSEKMNSTADGSTYKVW